MTRMIGVYTRRHYTDSVINIYALTESIYLRCCHSGLDPESSLWISGFPLEFIPMEIGAGMTPKIVNGFIGKRATMKILLVEDDKGIARFVKKGLSENEFSVDLVSDGEEGLRSVLGDHYDLIILDILLPKMDGLEILKRLREMAIQTPVVFLTAKDSESDIVHGLNLRRRRLSDEAVLF